MGLNNEFAPLPSEVVNERLTAHGLKPQDRYLLHVGHEHARKNRMAVLRTFAELQNDPSSSPVQHLVFVGSALTQEMIALIAGQPALAARVHVLRDVSHDHLRALYCGATALLFPSLQEGFGWPVIEAQACGCPVFASNLAPMNEIGSDAAVYVDPRDPQAIARAIRDAAPRFADMREGGLANAAHFSAAHMTARYVENYREVIAGRQSASAQYRAADRAADRAANR
jgi:glycosyltransferase involved in cell wall biosynthesis